MVVPPQRVAWWTTGRCINCFTCAHDTVVISVFWIVLWPYQNVTICALRKMRMGALRWTPGHVSMLVRIWGNIRIDKLIHSYVKYFITTTSLLGKMRRATYYLLRVTNSGFFMFGSKFISIDEKLLHIAHAGHRWGECNETNQSVCEGLGNVKNNFLNKKG